MLSFFVEVILPLPVQQTFTYAVPENLKDKVAFGKRVEVPFGVKKFYAGMIVSVIDEAPSYEVKSIQAVLDEQPLIYEQQFEFWQWMKSYYMASLGEIMKTAIPSALQVGSSSNVKLTSKFEGIHQIYQIAGQYNRKVLELSIELLNALSRDKFQPLEKMVPKLASKRWQSALNLLLDKEWIEIEHQLDQRYKPRTVTYLQLEETYRSSLNFKALQEELSAKPKQLEVINSYIEYAPKLGPVVKSKLLQNYNLSISSINTLVKNEILTAFKGEVSRLYPNSGEGGKKVILSQEQNQAYSAIERGFGQNKPVLLHGVTASGKTHVYFECIKKVVEEGRQVLYLLPEIALTTQLEKRIKARFGSRVGVYHSKYSHQERVEIWKKIYNREYDIVLAARSGIFLPFSDIGLIVVDEEHDFSYKQFDPTPRYHARDAAVYLSHIFKANILLGSATPSVDSAFNVVQDKYVKVALSQKFSQSQEPVVHIVDMKKSKKKGEPRPLFSDFLKDQISERLERKEQIILLQNRRGYVPVLECQDCGSVPMCKNCDINLTYYKYSNELRCHYCGHSEPLLDACNSCGSTELDIKGFGTEKVEEELKILYPEAKVKRMDLDSTRRKHAFQELIDDMELGQIDILVGTQMVTKGLDFSNVTLVGVLSAENVLSHLDYRSNERAFNMLSQVAGRTGRQDKEGAVVIQTFDIENTLLDRILRQDYKAYLRQELIERRDFVYPPYSRLVRITLKHSDVGKLEKASYELFQFLIIHFKGNVLGPEFAPIPRIRNRYIQQLVVKLDKGKELAVNKRVILNRIEDFRSNKSNRGVQLSIDVDPLN